MLRQNEIALVAIVALLLAGIWKRKEIVYTVENMMLDIRKAVDDKNVKRFLWLIRNGEGTSDANGYSRLYGGGNFASFADHPRTKQSFTFNNSKTVTSTAAGAYQFLVRTWDDIAGKNGLTDFTPMNQDLGAVALLKQSGALQAVIEGRFVDAIRKANTIWASLPESPYGQPTLTMAKAGAILVETLNA